jgi:hypothetical protein
MRAERDMTELHNSTALCSAAWTKIFRISAYDLGKLSPQASTLTYPCSARARPPSEVSLTIELYKFRMSPKVSLPNALHRLRCQE